MSDQDFDPVAEAFRGSVAYRVTHAAARSVANAVGDSEALRRARAFERSVVSPGRALQVKAAAIAIAVALLAHLAIREWLPRYATSGLPWWWHAAAALLAVIVAVWAQPVAAVWPDSSPAKLWRRFTS